MWEAQGRQKRLELRIQVKPLPLKQGCRELRKKEREAHKLYAQSEGKSVEGYITKINVSICHLAISY